MKPSNIIQSAALWALALAAACEPVSAQADFNSGSTGSFGALVVDETTATNSVRTIALPPDGILNCTTINIVSGYQLKFTGNAANTPVYLLATGDVTLDGYIYVDGSSHIGRRGGAGGPGGFDGGQGGTDPANGFGPGGGKGGWGAYSTPPAGTSYSGGGGYGTRGTETTTGGSVYGNSLLIPLVGGSGGGGKGDSTMENQYGGGGGGGAILVASNTKISSNYGSIYANGGYTPYYGGGSGGAIRLVSPKVTGNAYLYVAGSQGGGFGRIRVDSLSNALNVVGGSEAYASFGANMVVFPANLPDIRIANAAGTAIAATRTDPVFVLLPAGAPATQTVQVQVKNFNSVVPLVAVVTPEAGNRTTFNFDVNNTSGGTATGSVEVQIPAGVSTRIDVWTR
ncbi:hypothetical protein JIN84_00090 [Luteolibacter yonseiensis]|uniref:Glycine rich protein n=1 Tax=Luteolibacter yonseiensis TaxID=1144680 RepID=A0A934R1V8_9BACT|nr:hypothetical protein [Luteolibacter yonseiensis]MBK1814005.1 hypothetical protein [Luteolibacter yonseiensis]